MFAWLARVVGYGIGIGQCGFGMVVLEARRVAWGGSGRNGGQAIAGYACGESR